MNGHSGCFTRISVAQEWYAESVWVTLLMIAKDIDVQSFTVR